MSIADPTPRRKWRRVSPHEPCPICSAESWCSISANGTIVHCRRTATGACATKTDKNGNTYYVHRPPGDCLVPDSDATDADATTPAINQANPDLLHGVCSALIAALPLSAVHRANLRARGLPDSEIDRRGYGSLPLRGRRERVADNLHEQFGDVVYTVPGIVRRRRGDHEYLTIAGSAGILIPVRDIAGRIIALRIRHDDAGRGRYSYVSSAYDSGPGPGSPVHVPMGISSPSPRIRLTEGEIKANVAYALSGLPTMGVPGVSTWRPALEMLKTLGCQTVVLSMDMDAAVKPNVARPVVACADTLLGAGYQLQLERWPLADGKGIDDLLASGKQPELLEGDAARAAIRETALAAGVGPGPVGAQSAAASIRERLRAVLASDGAAGLYRDKSLIDALANLKGEAPTTYAEMREMLRCAKVSVRDFDRLMKVTIAAKNKERPAVASVDDTGGFFIAEGCICRDELTAEGKIAKPLCNLVAEIVDETVRDDGVERQNVLGLAGKLASGASLAQVEVPASAFADTKWVLEKWGGTPSSGPIRSDTSGRRSRLSPRKK